MPHRDTVPPTADDPGFSAGKPFGLARKARVLFLCAGDSSRSLMAEGWANRLGGDWIEARSADLEPHAINPRAIAAMCEAEVDISRLTPARLTPELLAWASLVVTIRGQVDGPCPTLPAWVRKNHWPLNDPARARGAEEEIAQFFRAARDTIRTCVTSLIVEQRARDATRR